MLTYINEVGNGTRHTRAEIHTRFGSMFDSHDDVVALKHIGVNIALLIGVMGALIVVAVLIG